MPNQSRSLTDQEILAQYQLISRYHSEYLANAGIKLPELSNKGVYTKEALVLVYLSLDYPNTKVVSKGELTHFIQRYDPGVNDVQQARHLGAQKGWHILSGSRYDVHNIAYGSYKLLSLETTYPGFMQQHRVSENFDWEGIKRTYDYRCATCGSKEGEFNYHWPGVTTHLQQGHKDPGKPLTSDNIIPQCQTCNRGDRNRWVYDSKGRVVKLANPSVISSCDEPVQLEVYRILFKKYGGKNPG